MSETNNNLGDDIKKGAEEAVDAVKETANEFAEGAKDAINEMSAGENKKIVAGILAILVGSFGIHKFYLGYTKEGIIQILLSFLCGVGGIIGLIEGIIYLTKSDEEFYTTYQTGKKPWF